MKSWTPRLWIAAVFLVLVTGIALSSLVVVPASAAASRLSDFDAVVRPLVAKMTLDEKVGQMTQAELTGLKSDSDVATLFLGSVFSGGNADPKTNSLQDWTDAYDRMQKQALTTRLGIPILYGVDAVHGHNNVIGAVVFPHNIGLGATRNAKLVEEISRVTAEEVRATGIQWAFAPCVAVVRDERWGRTYESYSEDPALVAELGAAAVRGLQHGGLNNPISVLGCAKHYAGDGGTTWGTGKADGPSKKPALDQGDTRVSEAELKKVHMPGYVTTIKEGVASIMPSYNSWNGEKASGSKRLLTDILKGELGFEGFLISDYNAIDDLPGDRRSDVKQSINAGMDMVMAPNRYREFYTTLKSLAEAGEIPMARIDDAVTRILRVKAAMGLLDAKRSHLADRSLQKTFGSAAHREVARRAVRESIVLLKNDGKALPVAKTAKRIHVAGAIADDIGSQCGGWTITWQGESGPVTTGTTILQALRAAVGSGTQVTYAKDGAGAAGADLGIVVVGEKPYAEMFGDRDDLALSAEDVAAVASVKKAGIPVVVVIVSGRPLILGDVAADANAILAAWLPGTEGQGVADVLVGAYKPTGKLSFTWPRSMAQIPINVGDAAYDPLYPYGFGKTY